MPITLTTPFTVSINGTQVENDNIGTCIGYSVDYIGYQMIFYFATGTLTGTTFTAGSQAQIQGKSLQINVSLISPYPWSASNGSSGSSITSTIMSPIISQLIANRNSADGFVSLGLMPGTTTAWTVI